MRKLFKLLTNKILITIFFFLLQVAFVAVLMLYLVSIAAWVYLVASALSLFVCLFVMGKNANPGYKLAWVVPILLVPLFGGLMYLSFGRTAKLRNRKDRKFLVETEKNTFVKYDSAIERAKDHIPHLSPSARKLSELLSHQSGYPVYNGTSVDYYPLGEDFLDALIKDLEKAQQYIFLEYFIIERGKCWNSILEILQAKVAEGVDVRLIYDDMGCLFTLPANYAKKMNAAGIKARVFNKIKPTFDIRMNNRTHRKIAVIDGNVAYTGGINLADEYINAIEKFGHWKDTAVRLEGEAAHSFAIMFLQFWLMLGREHTSVDEFLPLSKPCACPGFVQPVTSGPGKNVQIIEKGLMSIVSNADKYVYINTPYLILDNEFVTALCLAAESGVDVRITMPHIPDKKLVFTMSRSFYPVLLKSGVKIYEYLPGFVHAKSTVCDDSIAYVGTCNLDYRSFYLHYECGVFMYDVPAVADIKADYLATLEQCKQITYEEATDVTAFTKLARSVLRLFAPLM